MKYFLEQAVEASKLVADKYKGNLTENTGVLQQSADDPSNPYFDMFAQEDLSDVKEVLLWRQYARGLSTHNINAAAGRGNYRIGLTRGFVQNFLMKMVLRFMLTVLMRMVTAIIWATRRLLMYV